MFYGFYSALPTKLGVNLTDELQKSFDKKTKRDKDRHKNNPKLNKTI